MLFGKFHADSSGSEILYKILTSPTSSLLPFFSFSSLFSFTFLYNKAINEYYHIHLLTQNSFLKDYLDDTFSTIFHYAFSLKKALKESSTISPPWKFTWLR